MCLRTHDWARGAVGRAYNAPRPFRILPVVCLCKQATVSLGRLQCHTGSLWLGPCLSRCEGSLAGKGGVARLTIFHPIAARVTFSTNRWQCFSAARAWLAAWRGGLEHAAASGVGGHAGGSESASSAAQGRALATCGSCRTWWRSGSLLGPPPPLTSASATSSVWRRWAGPATASIHTERSAHGLKPESVWPAAATCFWRIQTGCHSRQMRLPQHSMCSMAGYYLFIMPQARAGRRIVTEVGPDTSSGRSSQHWECRLS